MPPGLGLVSNKPLDKTKQDMEDMPNRMKAMEEKMEAMRQEMGQDVALQAALAAGRMPSGEFGPEDTFIGARGGIYPSGHRFGSSDEYMEGLMANLAVLNGLNAGELVRRLDRIDAMLEELLGQQRALPPQILTSFKSEGSVQFTQQSQSPHQEPPGWNGNPFQPLPPMSPSPTLSMSKQEPLRAVKEEASADLSRVLQPDLPGHVSDEPITPEDMKPQYTGAKWIEVSLERDAEQPSWGLLWDRKSFGKKTRVLESLMHQTPAFLWNEDRKLKNDDFLQKGDELVKLNGKEGWEACNELSNLRKVHLTFRRVDQAERAKSRRQLKGRMDGSGSMQASMRRQSQRDQSASQSPQRQNLGSNSSNGRTPGFSPSAPITPTPKSPSPDFAATWERPHSGARHSESDPALIQVLKDNLKDNLESLEGLQSQTRQGDAGGHDLRNSEAFSPFPNKKQEELEGLVEKIIEHSLACKSAGKPHLKTPGTAVRFQELTKLATHVLHKEVEPALQEVITSLVKSSPGPDANDSGPIPVTDAANFLLDLLSFLASKVKEVQDESPKELT